MSTATWILLVAVAAVGWLLTSLLTRVAPSLGLIDRPDGRLKHHPHPIPVAGGIAVFAAIQFGAMVTGTFDLGLLAATGILLIVGLIDDLRTMSPRLRLALEAGAGLVLGLFADLPLPGAAGVIISMIVVAAVANAVNMLDGADGVAAGAVVASAIGLGVIALGRDVEAVPAAVAAAATAGFLTLNWPPARAYLGDGGAYVLGGVLAYLALGSHPDGALGTQLAALLGAAGALGILVLDLVVAVIRRRLAGVPLTSGDRSHLYDQLADRGWSPRRVAGAVIVAQSGLVAAACAIDRLVGGWPAVALLGVGFLLAIAGLWRAGFITPSGPRWARP